MAAYEIEVSEEAKLDLLYYTAFERKIITSGIRAQLADQPMVETQNRKPLRNNPLASWELRVGRYRVFYVVAETVRIVAILAVGHKEHNVLLIRGKEVKI